MAAIEESGPFKVIIAGAGIAGLTAAIGLRQQGHEVTIFEKSELAQEMGAAIHVAPNCHSILRRLGVFPEKFLANPFNGIVEYYLETLRMDLDLRQSLKVWQHPWVLSHRVLLHNELKRVATATEGDGPPAILRTSTRIVDVDPLTATVILEDGSRFSGDLIIGADGVGSATRKAVAGDDVKLFSWGKNSFRFLVPRQKILDNPSTRHFAAREGFMYLWYANDRRIVMYPCSNNTTMNFVATHPSEITGSKGDGLGENQKKQVLLETFKDFGPAVLELFAMADASELKLWPLLDMQQLSSWTKDKLALVGDAAHPFLPFQGQGGGIAIEDSASLCVLLPRGTPRHEIPERLALYERIRMERAHKVQAITRLAGRDLDDESRENFNIMEFNNYNFAHDEWHNSSHELRKWLWSRNGDTYWRQPVSFGPMTSPRQDHYGRLYPSKDARFTTYSVRVRTSTTYLQTLFPSQQFTFTWPGTKAEATFRCTELDNLSWLGGGKYRLFGVWIHGVQYTKKDGSKLFGSFLPVLFESLADPIITGREELGMPKLFCDINIAREGQRAHIICSWRGTEFVSMELNSLHKAEPQATANGNHEPAPPQDDGDFVYRYVPAVGRKGTADAEYPVFISHEKAATKMVVGETLIASSFKVDVQGRDWAKLPTLHHITSALAEIPIYEIIGAKVEEGRGIDDLAHAERIE